MWSCRKFRGVPEVQCCRHGMHSCFLFRRIQERHLWQDSSCKADRHHRSEWWNRRFSYPGSSVIFPEECPLLSWRTPDVRYRYWWSHRCQGWIQMKGGASHQSDWHPSQVRQPLYPPAYRRSWSEVPIRYWSFQVFYVHDISEPEQRQSSLWYWSFRHFR